MGEIYFSGVIIGFEQLPGFNEILIYAYGSVNGNETYFYVKIEKDLLEKYIKYGIGQRIEGIGEVLSENPFIVLKKK
ncbi:MAG: hypothetical protein QXP02_05840 [Desulfurococcaceae archaeon]